VTSPQLLEGGLFVDDRGQVGFVNDFAFRGIRRFYWVTNHKAGFVRAWHAHRKESKHILVVNGSALVGAVEIDNWLKPSKKARTWRFVLSALKPSILHIPAGFANGFMSLTDETKIMLFSNMTLEESRNDDRRFPARYWDIWTVEEH
jgi:dTDP-4-dehydrorhamnose 3,5-epimerase-like enzyme